MREWLRRFMDGRYGTDDLSRLLNIVVLALLVLGIFIQAFSLIAIALFGYNYFRILSRNTNSRVRENDAYLALRKKVVTRINALWQRVRQNGTHRFFRCPECRQSLRVPKGKGNITVTCPKCKSQFKKKS